MSPEAQQIAIARACGIPEPYTAWEQNGKTALAHSVRVENGMMRAKRVPDYLSDLNAMHEAEEVLTEQQFYDYYYALVKVWSLQAVFVRDMHPIRATAAQRAEAFLRTINLWQEGTV